ncbi:prolyl-tRNA synthetase associated domain-containing protein [Pseudoroseomonas cervicalis]|uniref:prolyl-tRNA synthetase associated domain-containing protein n=1 Tax=Teichococcus cervicalis TaxID=204525 RepID=UPI0022F1B8FD|nr:prolyl-tRNA synthetase associated domain-containing protein [Pseudoroseomonas cervicalis]WBV43537.1 prolyl-tRNA synthetase associated domain-containing protein [Pseudoroseomonas cervicalis]
MPSETSLPAESAPPSAPLRSGRPPETPEGVLARLAALGIAAETLRHKPLFTVADGLALRDAMPGLHVKNLFLQPKGEGPFLLLVLESDRQVKVNALVRALGVARASFASAEALWAELGVTPGSVTPLALVNSPPGRVRIAIDRMLLEAPRIHVHPLVNTASTALAPEGLLRFLRALGHAPEPLDLPGG